MRLRIILAFSVLALFFFGLSFASAQHTYVGADKCGKMCHKIEFDSWSKSKHATTTPPTECETSHGNGGDYWKMSVMKDPAAAKAAGLIEKPAKATCTAKCHKTAEFKDVMMTQVHDKKVKK